MRIVGFIVLVVIVSFIVSQGVGDRVWNDLLEGSFYFFLVTGIWAIGGRILWAIYKWIFRFLWRILSPPNAEEFPARPPKAEKKPQPWSQGFPRHGLRTPTEPPAQPASEYSRLICPDCEFPLTPVGQCGLCGQNLSLALRQRLGAIQQVEEECRALTKRNELEEGFFAEMRAVLDKQAKTLLTQEKQRRAAKKVRSTEGLPAMTPAQRHSTAAQKMLTSLTESPEAGSKEARVREELQPPTPVVLPSAGRESASAPGLVSAPSPVSDGLTEALAPPRAEIPAIQQTSGAADALVSPVPVSPDDRAATPAQDARASSAQLESSGAGAASVSGAGAAQEPISPAELPALTPAEAAAWSMAQAPMPELAAPSRSTPAKPATRKPAGRKPPAPAVIGKPKPARPSLDLRQWLLQPVVYENILWFLSSFLIISGVVYFVTSIWAQLAEYQRVYVLSGSLLAMSLFFFFSGRFLTHRFRLQRSGTVLSTLSLLLAPFVFIPLSGLPEQSIFLALLGCALALACFFLVSSSVGRLYHPALALRLPLTFLPLAFLQTLVPWIAGLPWTPSVLCIYVAVAFVLFALRDEIYQKLPSWPTVLYASVMLLTIAAVLVHWHLRRLGGELPMPMAVYGPLLIATAWSLALLRPLMPMDSIGDRPTHPLTAIGFMLVAMGLTVSFSDLPDSGRVFLVISLWAALFLCAHWARVHRRAYFVGLALALGVFAFFFLGLPIKQSLQSLREQLKGALGYQSGAKLPFSYYGISFLPYLAVVSYFAHRFRQKGERSFFRVTWIWLAVFSSGLLFLAGFLHKGDLRAPLATLPLFGLGYFYLAHLLQQGIFYHLASLAFAITLFNAGLKLEIGDRGLVFLLSSVGLVWWALGVLGCRKPERASLRAALFDTALLAGIAAMVFAVMAIQTQVLSSYYILAGLLILGLLWSLLTAAFRHALCSIVAFLSLTGAVALLGHLLWPTSHGLTALFLALWGVLLSSAEFLLRGLTKPQGGSLFWLARPGRESVAPFGDESSWLFGAYILTPFGLSYSLALGISLRGHFDPLMLLTFMVLALTACLAIRRRGNHWAIAAIAALATGLTLIWLEPTLQNNAELSYQGLGYSLLALVAGFAARRPGILTVGVVAVTSSVFLVAYALNASLTTYLGVLESLLVLGSAGSFLLSSRNKDDARAHVFGWAAMVLLWSGLGLVLAHHLLHDGGNAATALALALHTLSAFVLYFLPWWPRPLLSLEFLGLSLLWCLLGQISWLVWPEEGLLTAVSLLYAFGLAAGSRKSLLTQRFPWMPGHFARSEKSIFDFLGNFSLLVALATYLGASLFVLTERSALAYLSLCGIALYLCWQAVRSNKAAYAYGACWVLHHVVLLTSWYFAPETDRFWYEGLPVLLQAIYSILLCVISTALRPNSRLAVLRLSGYTYGSLLATGILAFLVTCRIWGALEPTAFFLKPLYAGLSVILTGPVLLVVSRQAASTLGLYPSLTAVALLAVYLLDYVAAGSTPRFSMLGVLHIAYFYPLAFSGLSVIYIICALAAPSAQTPLKFMSGMLGILAFSLALHGLHRYEPALGILIGLLLAGSATLFSWLEFPRFWASAALALLLFTFSAWAINDFWEMSWIYQPLAVLLLLSVILAAAVLLKERSFTVTLRGHPYRLPTREWAEASLYFGQGAAAIALITGLFFLLLLIGGSQHAFYAKFTVPIQGSALALLGLTLLLLKIRNSPWEAQSLILTVALLLGLFCPFNRLLGTSQAFPLPDLEMAGLALAFAFLRWRNILRPPAGWILLFGLSGVLLTELDTRTLGTPLTLLLSLATALLVTMDTGWRPLFYGGLALLVGSFSTLVSYWLPYDPLSAHPAITSLLCVLFALASFILAVNFSAALKPWFWDKVREDLHYGAMAVNLAGILLVAHPLLDLGGSRLAWDVGWLHLAVLLLSGLNLGLQGKRSQAVGFFYGLQALLFTTYLFARRKTHYLDGLPLSFDPYLIVIFGTTFFYAYLATRERWPISLAQGLRLGGIFYPLIGLFIAPWILPWQASVTSSGLLAVMAAHYGIVAMVEHKRWQWLLSALLTNCALGLYWRTWGVVDPQFYGIPLGLTVIFFAELNRQDLTRGHLQFFRLLGLLLIYLSAGIQIFLITNLKYAMMLGAWAMIGIFVGLKIGNPLYWITSTLALILDVVGHLIATFGMRHHFGAAGLLVLVGLSVLVLNIYLNAKRERGSQEEE